MRLRGEAQCLGRTVRKELGTVNSAFSHIICRHPSTRPCAPGMVSSLMEWGQFHNYPHNLEKEGPKVSQSPGPRSCPQQAAFSWSDKEKGGELRQRTFLLGDSLGPEPRTWYPSILDTPSTAVQADGPRVFALGFPHQEGALVLRHMVLQTSQGCVIVVYSFAFECCCPREAGFQPHRYWKAATMNPLMFPQASPTPFLCWHIRHHSRNWDTSLNLWGEVAAPLDLIL